MTKANDKDELLLLQQEVAALTQELNTLQERCDLLQTQRNMAIESCGRIKGWFDDLSDSHVALIKTNNFLQSEYDRLVELIKVANARTFGAKSEKISPNQISLFNDMEAAYNDTVKEPSVEDMVSPKKSRKQRKPIDWSRYENETFEHELPENQRICPQCGTIMQDMGNDTKRVIKLIPARIIVEVHRVHKYVCPICSKKNAEDGGQTPVQIVRAQGPVLPLPKSVASPSLLAYIVKQKYELALPINRIAKDLKTQQNLHLSKNTLANWVIKSYERWLAMLYELMKEKLLNHDIIHCDETRIQVLKEPDRKPTTKSFMWLFATAAHDTPIRIYTYDMHRGADVARNMLKGWSGTIVTDGYRAYNNLSPDIKRVVCLVHIRRGFIEVVQAAGGREPSKKAKAYALEAWKRIDELFAIDKTLKDLTPEERAIKRQELLKPKMDEFLEWAKQARALYAAPRMKLANALKFAIDQWPNVENVLYDGRLPLENNLAERAIRPFTVGRKNWLFSDTQRGARASAGIYSIVVTAGANGLKAYNYLEWLFTEMPATKNLQDKDVLSRFLPWSSEVPDSCKMSEEELKAYRANSDDYLAGVDLDALQKEMAKFEN